MGEFKEKIYNCVMGPGELKSINSSLIESSKDYFYNVWTFHRSNKSLAVGWLRNGRTADHRVVMLGIRHKPQSRIFQTSKSILGIRYFGLI